MFLNSASILLTAATVLSGVITAQAVQCTNNPPGPVKRIVADPPITSPDADTVWVVGDVQLVTWNITDLPAPLTNPNGTLLLGFVNDTSGNEHLLLDNPLATNFSILAGGVNITVPPVEPRNDYVVALLGDSGNISPRFTITNLPNQAGQGLGNDTTNSTTPTLTTNSTNASTVVSGLTTTTLPPDVGGSGTGQTPGNWSNPLNSSNLTNTGSTQFSLNPTFTLNNGTISTASPSSSTTGKAPSPNGATGKAVVQISYLFLSLATILLVV